MKTFNVATNLMLPLILKNIIKILKHYQNKPKFNGVYSRNNLSKKRMGHI